MLILQDGKDVVNRSHCHIRCMTLNFNVGLPTRGQHCWT